MSCVFIEFTFFLIAWSLDESIVIGKDIQVFLQLSRCKYVSLTLALVHLVFSNFNLVGQRIQVSERVQWFLSVDEFLELADVMLGSIKSSVSVFPWTKAKTHISVFKEVLQVILLDIILFVVFHHAFDFGLLLELAL